MRNIMKLFLTMSVVFFLAAAHANIFGAIGAPTVVKAPVALNEASVVVADRSDAALQTALESAFSEVVIKMSGNPNAMDIPAVKKAAKNVTRWVESYSYLSSPNASEQKAAPLMLQVVFDQKGLQRLLSKKYQAENSKDILNSPTKIFMLVSGIHNDSDFQQMIQSLRDKNDVMRVSVKKMQGDHVLLRIKVIGGRDDFQKLLESDNRFKSASNGEQTKRLKYEWVGNQT